MANPDITKQQRTPSVKCFVYGSHSSSGIELTDLSEQLQRFSYTLLDGAGGDNSFTYRIELVDFDERFWNQVRSLFQVSTGFANVKSTEDIIDSTIEIPRIVLQFGYRERFSSVHIAQISNIEYIFRSEKEKVLIIEAVDLKNYVGDLLLNTVQQVTLPNFSLASQGTTRDEIRLSRTDIRLINTDNFEPYKFSDILDGILTRLSSTIVGVHYENILSEADKESVDNKFNRYVRKKLKELEEDKTTILPSGSVISLGRLSEKFSQAFTIYNNALKQFLGDTFELYNAITRGDKDIFVPVEESVKQGGIHGYHTGFLSQDQINTAQVNNLHSVVSSGKTGKGLSNFDEISSVYTSDVVYDKNLFQLETEYLKELILESDSDFVPFLDESDFEGMRVVASYATLDTNEGYSQLALGNSITSQATILEVVNNDTSLGGFFRVEVPDKLGNYTATIKPDSNVFLGDGTEDNPFQTTTVKKIIDDRDTAQHRADVDSQLDRTYNDDFYDKYKDELNLESGVSTDKRTYASLGEEEKLEIDYSQMLGTFTSQEGIDPFNQMRDILDNYNNQLEGTDSRLTLEITNNSTRSILGEIGATRRADTYETSFAAVSGLLQNKNFNDKDLCPFVINLRAGNPSTDKYTLLDVSSFNIAYDVEEFIQTYNVEDKEKEKQREAFKITKPITFNYGASNSKYSDVVTFFKFSGDMRLLANLAVARRDAINIIKNASTLNTQNITQNIIPSLQKILNSTQFLEFIEKKKGKDREMWDNIIKDLNNVIDVYLSNETYDQIMTGSSGGSLKSVLASKQALNQLDSGIEFDKDFQKSITTVRNTLNVRTLPYNVLQDESKLDELTVFLEYLSSRAYSHFLIFNPDPEAPYVYKVQQDSPFDVYANDTSDNDARERAFLAEFVENSQTPWELKVKTLGIPELDTIAEIVTPRAVYLKVTDLSRSARGDYGPNYLDGVYRIIGLSHVLDRTGYTSEFTLLKEVNR